MSSFWNSPAWSMGKKSGISNRKSGHTKNTVHNPGPGNYTSSVNIGKHQPSWKYSPFYAELAMQEEVDRKSTMFLDQETTISITVNPVLK